MTSIPTFEDKMNPCNLCPRRCQTDRTHQKGFCGESVTLRAARAALHFWEEPVLSGSKGSGAVFFSGCNLRCVFCQNHSIANSGAGKEISVDRLVEIFFDLKQQGAHNINLVTPSHFVPQIQLAIEQAKKHHLNLPFIYNSSAYEKVETLELLEGLIDIYLPDCKYYSPELSKRYSHAHDYFSVASKALAEMFRQVGPPVLSSESNYTLLRKGMIVRHLLLPGQTKDSKKILRFLYETYGNDIFISIMNQYTPMPQIMDYPELNRKVTDEEYERVLRFARRLGIERGFLQEGDTATESFIPEFDYTGI